MEYFLLGVAIIIGSLALACGIASLIVVRRAKSMGPLEEENK